MQHQSSQPMLPPSLAENAYLIRDLDPLSQSIDYHPRTWKKRFGSDPDFVSLNATASGAFSRANVQDLAREAVASSLPSDARRLFLASMIWGYGTVGYGAYRTQIMLSPPNIADQLHDLVMLVSAGQIEQAFNLVDIDMCGPAFFTKYFYFIGLGGNVEPAPLIFDSRVADTLEKIGVSPKEFGRVTRKKDGSISSVYPNGCGYVQYLDLMHDWSAAMSCRPDAVELALFNELRFDDAA